MSTLPPVRASRGARRGARESPLVVVVAPMNRPASAPISCRVRAPPSSRADRAPAANYPAGPTLLSIHKLSIGSGGRGARRAIRARASGGGRLFGRSRGPSQSAADEAPYIFRGVYLCRAYKYMPGRAAPKPPGLLGARIRECAGKACGAARSSRGGAFARGRCGRRAGRKIFSAPGPSVR